MKVIQNWQKILFLCVKYLIVLQSLFYLKGKIFSQVVSILNTMSSNNSVIINLSLLLPGPQIVIYCINTPPKYISSVITLPSSPYRHMPVIPW